MGMNSFAEWSSNPNCFVVQNIGTNPKKTIKIFNYPINYGDTRDLLKIPGVGPDDIKVSLLKGQLNHKIRTNEIIVLCSDIDLLQFDSAQKTFLQNAGIVNGLDAGGAGSGITEDEHQALRQLIHFIDNGPAQGFASGATRTTTPTGSPFPTAITWYIDSSQTTKIVEKLITYNSDQVPTTIVWNMYAVNGITIIHSITDTIIYANNVFESIRTRSISV